MASESKTYTKTELKAHGLKNEKSTWIAIQGKVYDVTQWKEEHPGGREILIQHSGADCTYLFEVYEHSSDASELLPQYYIGDLEPETGTEAEVRHTQHHTADETGFLMLYGLPLLAVIIAYIVMTYFLL